MSSTNSNSEIRELLKQTQARYPHQSFSAETLRAYFEDWCEMCNEFGLKRFTEGVKRARSYCDFFPMPSKIRELIPEAHNSDLEFSREMADLKMRKAAGEKFYTLADVFTEVARRINAGEVKPSDPGMKIWARTFNRAELLKGKTT